MPIPDVTDLDQTVAPLIYERPHSSADGRAGRVCTASGMWAPGHCLVYVDGAPYIAEYAPSCSAKEAATRIARYRKNLQSPV